MQGPRESAPTEQTILDLLRRWRSAWASGDWESYVANYDPAFRGDARSRAAWESNRRTSLRAHGIDLRVRRIEVVSASADRFEVRFLQEYTRGSYADVGMKKLAWRRLPALGWRIVGERWTPAAR